MEKDDWRCGPNIGRNTNTPWFRAVYDDEDNAQMPDAAERADYITLEEAERKYATDEKPGV